MAHRPTNIVVQSYLVQDPGSSAQKKDVQDLVHAVESDHSELLKIVTGLSSVLTSDDDEHRAKGLWLLSDLLKNISNDAVSRQAVITLSEFFTQQSSLQSCTHPALVALVSLAKHPSFGHGEAIKVCNALFEHVDMRSLIQSVRYYAYSILDILVAKHMQALQSMGNQFLTNYCKLVSGEKDPRNLSVAFSIDRVILIEFDIKDVVDDFFDITFCYFPITFTPSPNDPYKITSEKLQVLLRSCLAANPHFAPAGLPLILEKLQASTSTAKKQALEAIFDCFPVYGKAEVSSFAKKFWDALSVEIFHATEPEIETLAIEATKVLLKTIYPSTTAAATTNEEDMVIDTEEYSRKDIRGIAPLIIDTCIEEIADPGKSKAIGASRVLAKTIEASEQLGSHVISKAIPVVYDFISGGKSVAATQTGSSGQEEARRAGFSILETLISAIRTSSSSTEQRIQHDFGAYKEDLFVMLLHVVISSSTSAAIRTSAMGALCEFIRTKYLLDDSEAELGLTRLTEVMLCLTSGGNNDKTPDLQTEEDTSDVDELELADSALAQIEKIAESRSELVNRICLTKAFEQVQVQESERYDRKHYQRALVALGSLCKNSGLFETFIVRILGKLENAATPILATTAEADLKRERDIYVRCILLTIEQVIRGMIDNSTRDNIKESSNSSNNTKLMTFLQKGATEKIGSTTTSATRTGTTAYPYSLGSLERSASRIIVRLAGIFILSTTTIRSATIVDEKDNYRLVSKAAEVMGLVVSCVDEKTQSDVCVGLVEGFGPKGDLKKLCDGARYNQQEQLPFEPIFNKSGSNVNRKQELTILIFTEMMCSLRSSAMGSESENEVIIMKELLQKGERWYNSSNDDCNDSLKVEAVLQMLCSIVNKLAGQQGGHVSKFVDEMIPVWRHGAEKSRWILEVLSWVIRGLVVRGDSRGYVCLEVILDLVDNGNEEVQKRIPSMLEVIASSEDGLLDKSRHGIMRLLYKQRFYGAVIPRLVQDYKEIEQHEGVKGEKQGKKKILVEALASLVAHAPPRENLQEYAGMLARETTALGCEEKLVRHIFDSVYNDDKKLTGVKMDVQNDEGDHADDDLLALSSADQESLVQSALEQSTDAQQEATRRAALRCLGRLGKLRTWGMETKRRVIQGTARAVDDERRSVRREAVDARAVWMAK